MNLLKEMRDVTCAPAAHASRPNKRELTVCLCVKAFFNYNISFKTIIHADMEQK